VQDTVISESHRGSHFFGSEIIKEAERQVEIIGENLKTTQSRQKSYADPKRREVVFEVGDYAYLRVSPIRGLRRFNSVLEESYLPTLSDLFQSWKDEGKWHIDWNYLNAWQVFTMCFMYHN
jgi:hypothetical protein